MAENLLFFTELLRMPVCDLKGRRIGRVRDAALVPVVNSARVDRVLIGGDRRLVHDPLRSGRFHFAGFRPDSSRRTAQPLPRRRVHAAHGRDLLDQQIIDVTGRKVVRVNRPHLRDPQRRRARYARGARSGYRHPQHLPPPVARASCRRGWIRRLQRPIPPNSIRWEFCNVVEPDPQRRLRLNISYKSLEDMHPADLADIVEELSPAEREAIFETIDSEAAADALSEVDPKMQASILESLEPEKAADIVEEMAPDEAADALAELEEETSRRDPRRDGARAQDRSPANCSNSRRIPPAA